MADRRYHVELKDDYSGQSLGLILQEHPQLGLDRRLINPYAAKTGQGNTKYSDLTEWTVVAQDDWRGGRGQDKFEEPTRFFDSRQAETRIEGQVTLGPKPLQPLSDFPENEAAPDGHRLFGRPHSEACMVGASGDSGGAIPYGNTTLLAQRVNAPYHSQAAEHASMSVESVELSLKKQAGFADQDTITCSVYSDADGEPDSSLGSTSLNGSDLTTAFAWHTFTFSAPIDVSDHPHWWIVLSTSSTDKVVQWQPAYGDDSYPRGYVAQWNGTRWLLYAGLDLDFLFKANWASVKVAQSFTTGATGWDLDSIWLHGSAGLKRARVALYSDSGDAPETKIDECVLGFFWFMYINSGSTTTVIQVSEPELTIEAGMWVRINGEARHVASLGTDEITLSTALSSAPEKGDRIRFAYNFFGVSQLRARLPSTPTLTATTKYWIVLEETDASDGRPTHFPNGWLSVSYGGTYADGTAKQQVASQSYTDLGLDLRFRLNDFSLDGDVTAFARFDGEWYCATGPSVFKYSEASQGWSEVDGDDNEAINSTDTVTGLVAWGGYLWAARGSDHVIRRSSDGSSWADVTGEYANLLHAGGGYLYSSGIGANSHKVYGYNTDTSAFEEIGECGAGEHPVTAMAVYLDRLFASTAIALWSLEQQGFAYPVLDWTAQEHEDNGKGMTMWNKDNALYIPLRYGLYRWNGDSMVPAGPERGTGLPEVRSGTIVDLCATNNWLYAAIDAGATNISSVLCYNGMGGWHEMARSEDGQRILSLGFSTIQDLSRLWYGMGQETRYLELPDRGDNPWQWRGYLKFNPSGSVTTSWFGSDLLEVMKNIHEIVVRGEGINEDQTVDVYLEVDRSGLEIYWGQIAGSPRESIAWGSKDWHTPGWREREVQSGSQRNRINVDSTFGISSGDFLRINGEITQAHFFGTGRFTGSGDEMILLTSSLSEAPEAGDTVYAAAPAGREFRVRLELSNEEGVLGATPKVDAVLVRYQNHVLDRYLWTLRVNVEDGLKDLSGADYGMTAADLRAELDSWSTRLGPFTLVDPDGREHRVKVASAGEGGYSRERKAGGQAHYDSTYGLTLVEVE